MSLTHSQIDAAFLRLKIDRLGRGFRTRDEGFEESKHPRAEDGKFGSGGGGSDKEKPKAFEKSDSKEWEFGSGKIPTGEDDTPFPSPASENNPMVVLTPMRSEVFDDARKFKLDNVAVKDLQSWQRLVRTEDLRPIEGEPPPIEVFKINGKLVIANGNHRAVDAYLEGKETIFAKVADMDDPKMKKYWKKKK